MPKDLGLNLLSGVAQAMGADTSQLDKRIEQRSADRAATQHEELAAQTHAILQDVSMLQKRRSELDPNSPTYQKDVTEIDSNLHSARQAFTDLYHPEKNPGALAKFGGFLQAHLGGIKKADRALDAGRDDSIPKTPGEARKKFDLAGLDAAAAGPGQAPANPILEKKKQLLAAGFTEQEAEKAIRITEGLEGKAGAVKPESPDKPTKQTSDERARADFAEFKKAHPEYKGTFERWRKEQGTLPKTPGPAKPERLSPAQNKAQSEYMEAVKLSDLADQVAQTPNDAINQKRLAVSLERMSAGRFTTQALDYIIKAGWGNTVEQWANNPSTGALPADVMRQLVAGAHENMQAAKAGLDTAMELSAHIPTTPAEARKKVTPPAPDDDDKFLQQIH